MDNVFSIDKHRLGRELREMLDIGLIKTDRPISGSDGSLRIQVNPLPVCSELNYIRSIKFPKQLLIVPQDKSYEEICFLVYAWHAWHTIVVKDLDKLGFLRRTKKIRVIEFFTIDEDDGRPEAIVLIKYSAKINNKTTFYEVKVQCGIIEYIFNIIEMNMDLDNIVRVRDGHYLNISDEAKMRLLEIAENYGSPLIYGEDQLFYQDLSTS